MSKHTPGPWTVDSEQICARSLDYVAVIPMEFRRDGLLTEEDRANAALIAAAPDMLAALEYVAANFTPSGMKVRKDFSKMTALVAVDKAIAKAKAGK